MTDQTFDNGSCAYALDRKPNKPYGAGALLPVDSGDAWALVAPAIGRIPPGSVIHEAYLGVYQEREDWSEEVSLTARRVGAWKVSRVTFNNPPTILGPARTTTPRTGSPKNSLWEFDVKDDVALFHAGTAQNFGWQITSSSTARRRIRGYPANRLKPYLRVVYSPRPATPTDVRPASGAVSVVKPVVTFNAGEFSSLQVQLSEDDEFTTTLFDSGEVSATEGRFDLADAVGWAGATSTPTYFRARVRNGGDWSDWSLSSWFTYSPLPVIMITAPGATVADSSPVVAWTMAGQVQRRIVYRDAAGKALDDTGWHVSTSQAYSAATDPLLKQPGLLTVDVYARDAVERASTEGAPDYSFATVTTEYVRSDAIAPVTQVNVTADGALAHVSWHRDELSDGAVIEQGGLEVATVETADALVSDNWCTWLDWTTPAARRVPYRVLPVVNGETGSASPVASVVTHPGAAWLMDPEAGDRVPLLFEGDVPDVTLSPMEVFSTFDALDGTRHRHRRASLAPTGSFDAVLMLSEFDGDPITAAALLRAWGEEGTRLRLVVAPANVEVVIGEVRVDDPHHMDSADDPIIRASLTYWLV